MNFKLLFPLSLFGLIMAIGTVSVIPERAEFMFWLAIFIFCAAVIAKAAPGKYFLHGFALSIINCLWITLLHTLFYRSYALHHPDTAAMNSTLPGYFTTHPRITQIAMAPVFGILFGVIQGLFALIASKIITRKQVY